MHGTQYLAGASAYAVSVISFDAVLLEPISCSCRRAKDPPRGYVGRGCSPFYPPPLVKTPPRVNIHPGSPLAVRLYSLHPHGPTHRETQHGNKHTHGGEGHPVARASRWPYIRTLAWKRDSKTKARCHICGEPIDYFVKPSSTPDSYEPDHIQPVHLRPDLELDLNNIAASHRKCNRQRGDGQRNLANDLGMKSRIW